MAFNVVPADLLGTAFRQSLGSINGPTVGIAGSNTPVFSDRNGMGKEGAPMLRLKEFELPDDCLGRSSRGMKLLNPYRNIKGLFTHAGVGVNKFLSGQN